MPNKSFGQILKEQAAAYPLMQCQDLVKLAYQAALGAGHMVSDEAGSLQRLTSEISRLPDEPAAGLEPLGNGLVRFHLGALAKSGLSARTLNRFFLLTGERHIQDLELFLAYLDQLQAAVRSGLPLVDPPTEAELASYLADYAQKGRPAVSHSESYRQAYRPAYRVVREEFLPFLPLYSAIDRQLAQKEKVLVALDGNSGAGKSTLARTIQAVYGGNLFHMDDFFLTPQLRSPERLAEIGGNIDYERFSKEVLAGLASGQPFSYRSFDCQTNSYSQPIRVAPHQFNLVEGVYSLHPRFSSHYSLKVLLRIARPKQKKRILARSGPVLYERFIREWIPMEDRFYAMIEAEETLDLVFDI